MNRRTYSKRLPYGHRAAARKRAEQRPGLLVVALVSLSASAFLAWAIGAALTHPPLDGHPEGFASALGMLGVMAATALVLGVVAIWEARP